VEVEHRDAEEGLLAGGHLNKQQQQQQSGPVRTSQK
jgi:hypothetical protein